MIFNHGHIHCDAHPGNIMVTFPNMTTTEKDSRNCSTSWQPQPVLLDFGMTIKLLEAHRLGYAKLIYSVSRFDLQGLKEAFTS